ncbi:DUF445 domain-containing protein [Ilumatobacter nonamiensis]|uniref:DUF445 domain-containing protein n=1 Tax=Ilumatobacter nonamiensis TaxID=467093 RepID=UPI000349142C|nr:DUF445 domain-containing protein [Ilumatobacter nonamiensis]
MTIIDQAPPPVALDDDERARRLRQMKLIATSLFLFAAVVFVVAKIKEDDADWIGYVRAVAEAAMVGALADWFAVTALFRHPLGLPIPHTAIIPKRKDDIGRSLGGFVESNFLTADVIETRLRDAHVGQRLGEWLADPGHAERTGDAMADVVRGGLEVLDDEEIQSGLEHVVRTRIQSTQVSPMIGRAIELTMEGGHHQRLLDAAIVGLDHFLLDNRATFRERLYQESPWWVPEGIDDRVFDKIYDVLGRFLADVLDSPHHQVRASVDERATDFARRLREDPELHRKGEELKQELLDHPEVRRWIDSLWTETKASMLVAIDDPDSELRRRIASSTQRLGERLADEPELQRKVDDWIASALGHLVANYRNEVSDLIESTVAKWDADATADKLELQVGRDLQFIRINGTIVGGLAGFVIHAIGQLL